MKKLLMLLILVGLGYFIYESYIHSDAINQESIRNEFIREEGLEDFESILPKSTQDALIEAKSETDTLFNDLKMSLQELRFIVNEKIEALW